MGVLIGDKEEYFTFRDSVMSRPDFDAFIEELEEKRQLLAITPEDSRIWATREDDVMFLPEAHEGERYTDDRGTWFVSAVRKVAGERVVDLNRDQVSIAVGDSYLSRHFVREAA